MEVIPYLLNFQWIHAWPYLIILFITWLFYCIIVRPLTNPLVRQLRGPSFIPLIGNVREIICNETITRGVRWAKKYGHVMRYFAIFGEVRLILMSPEALKHVLVTHSKNYGKNKYSLRILRRILGDGLVTTDGSIHAAHRKLANPSFGSASIKKMTPIFTSKAKELCEFWEDQMRADANENNRKEFNISGDFMRTTMDVIGECAMGYSFNCLQEPDHEVSMAFRNVINCLNLGLDLFLPYWYLWPTKRVKTINRNMKLIDDVVKTIIHEKEEKFASATEEEREGLLKDLLSMLMLARDDGSGVGLTEKELKDHVVTFIFAGHETTSHGLTWLMLHLAQHPEIQDKLREEVMEHVPNDTDNLQMETIDKMEYLNAVIKETLRFTPPVAMAFRENIKDDTICGHHIPAGTSVHVHIAAVMRLPEYWDDPETFKPERFLDGRTIDQYTWLPFVLGNRMCIGYRFALLEMKIITAMLIRKFKFSWVPGYTYKMKMSITMRPEPPLRLFVEEV